MEKVYNATQQQLETNKRYLTNNPEEKENNRCYLQKISPKVL